MEQSIKSRILEFLTEKKDFVFGGTVEDYIREIDHKKASNASRRLRELCEEGRIEARYVKVPGVSNRVVQYRLKTPQNAPRAEISENVAKILASWQKPPIKETNKLF